MVYGHLGAYCKHFGVYPHIELFQLGSHPSFQLLVPFIRDKFISARILFV